MMKRILAGTLGTLLLIATLWIASLSALGIYQQYWQLPELAARMGTTVVSRHTPSEIAKLVDAWAILTGVVFVSVRLLLFSAKQRPATRL